MSHESVAELNLAYSRLERQVGETENFRLFVVPGESGRRATSIVKQIMVQKESIDIGVAENLMRTLRVIASDFWGYCAPENVTESYWSHRLAELETQILEIAGFLPQSVLSPLNELAQNLVEWGSASSAELFAVLDTQITQREKMVALALATPRLSKLVADWVPTWFENGKVTVARAASLRALNIAEVESVIWMGAPHLLFRRPDLEKIARALCLSGASEDVAFIAPRWACSSADEKAMQALLPFESDTRLPRIIPIGATQVDLGLGVADEIEDEDLAPTQEAAPSQAPLLRSGTTPCRLLHLGQRFSLPVEEDASRVTTVSKNPISDKWEAKGKHPFDGLGESDLVLAIIDSSETADLRKRAGIAMDERFPVYESAQKGWKSKLSEMEQRLGQHGLESQLASFGLSAGHRYSYWLDPDTLSPQTNEDFRKLLLFLEFSETEVSQAMELNKEFRAHLIAEGLRAGMEVVQILNEEEREPHSFDSGKTVILEELGNATYLIAPVTSVSSEIILCDPSQVRTLVARREDTAG